MKHSLAEATRLILPAGHGLRNPERWVSEQLCSGRFHGQKIGRKWFMTDADIEHAEQALYPPAKPKPAEPVEDTPGAIITGLSKAARRRVRASA